MRRSSYNSGVRIRGQYSARDFSDFFKRASRSSRCYLAPNVEDVRRISKNKVTE
jgi:hypothetical protein